MSPIPWFKVDDQLATHPKVLRMTRKLRPSAMGLWLLAGTWAASNLTDGFVPRYMLREIGATDRMAQGLVEAGLWIEESDGYRFHDWADHQPTKSDVIEKRTYERDKKRNQRRAKDGRYALSEAPVPAVSPGDTPGSPEGVPTLSHRPDPTRPDPTNNRGQAARELDLVGEPDSAGPTEQIVAEWIAWLGDDKRPPTKIVTAVGKQIAELLADGIPYRDVKRGLIQWQTRGTLGPAVLPSIVHEVRTARPNNGDRRQAATADLFARALERAQDPDQQKAIGS